MAKFKKIKKLIDIIPPQKVAVFSVPEVETKYEKSGIENIIDNIIALPVSNEEELEMLLNQENDPVIELARAGAVFSGRNKSEQNSNEKPKIKNLEHENQGTKESKTDEDEFHQKIISQIRAPVARSVVPISSLTLSDKLNRGSSISLQNQNDFGEIGMSLSSVKPSVMVAAAVFKKEEPELPEPRAGFVVEERIVDFYQKSPVTTQASYKSADPVTIVKKKSFDFSPPRKKNFSKLFLVMLGISGIFAYGFTLKNELIRDGTLALENLGQAQEHIENFNFTGAAESFGRSYDDFVQAGQNLNLMGVGLLGMFSDIPGAGKFKSAKDLVEVGKLISSSGKAMSEALSILSKTGIILNPHDSNKTKPLSIINQLKDALAVSGRNFDKAKALISDIDETIIPDDKKEYFLKFKEKMPVFEKILADSSEYLDFMEGIIGIDESKKYLLLFHNNSELRPTGGFPGTYGVVSFSSGGLQDFFVDDVYNLDGQLKDNIIPPKQLQHITPTWGMRDSGWFIDFPTSAKKTMWFFNQEAGYGVDGVITLNPDVVRQILEIVGPIDLPDYDLTLTSDNFLSSIQEEVEYGENRVQPKKVVVDFAPRFLEKLYSADSEKWTRIFNVMMNSLEEKDILFYFNDKNLEKFTIEKGFGGEVKKTDSDYLMVTFSNVKGSKTDAVTDNSIVVDSWFEDGAVAHKVEITRKHNGGDHEHEFYNKQNPAYVRVLLPEGAEFMGITGNDTPNFKSLMNYGMFNFTEDKDLNNLESGVYFNKDYEVDIYEESGLTGQARKGIGFWMITDPEKTKKVEIEYNVPVSAEGYRFYFQKQPGMDWKNFKFMFTDDSERKLISSTPSLNRVGDVYVLEQELKRDLNIKIDFQ